MDPWVVNQLVVPLAGMATGVIISVAFFKTIRHFIDRRAAGSIDAELRAEVADLHARIDGLEHGIRRVDDLEDRIDFAERLLARAGGSDVVTKEP